MSKLVSFFYMCNFAGSNRGGMIKKAKKCLRTEAVKERVRNYHPLENPSFEVEMSQSYAKGCYLVCFLSKFSILAFINNLNFFEGILLRIFFEGISPVN